jgi:Ca2+-binding RTX toxin-like protein
MNLAIGAGGDSLTGGPENDFLDGGGGNIALGGVTTFCASFFI